MENARNALPQVNLRDRIAALQQRTSSPPTPEPISLSLSPVSPSATSKIPVPGTGGGVGSLRDKIANFERKGAVPVPRGRFGSSAPANADPAAAHVQSKKRGELYGNRVPELAKSTAEAVLLVRHRTVSTAGRQNSSSRPTSPAASSSPPLLLIQPQRTGDGSFGNGGLAARLPSAVGHGDRRSVSDVLPRGSASVLGVRDASLSGDKVQERVQVGEKKQEEQAEEVQEEEGSVVVVAETAGEEPPRPVEVPPAVLLNASNVASNIASDEPAPEAEQRSSTDTITATAPAVTSPAADPDPVAVVSTDADAATPVEAVQDVVLPSTAVQDVPPPPTTTTTKTADTALSLGTEVISRNASAASEETPSDSASFQTAESDEDTTVAYTGVVQLQDAIPAVEKVLQEPTHSPVVEPVPTQNAESKDTGVLQATVLAHKETTPVAEAAFVLKHKETPPVVEAAVSVSTKPQTAETPRVAAMPAPDISSPPPASPSDSLMYEQKAVRKSFHAVVHRKVREPTPAAAEPTVAPRPMSAISPSNAQPKKATPSFPPPKATAPVQRVVSQTYLEPDSPSLGDLASLVFDAALLEEQLTTPGAAASQKPTPPQPTFHVQPAIPEETRESASFEAHQHQHPRLASSPSREFSSPSSADSQQSFVSHLRAETAPGGTTTASGAGTTNRNSQGPKYFSSLRARNTSMPGAYPRTSVCSEMSTDSSVLVSTPQDMSDASSVRSSSKSWKSSKKGISRASSWLFRGKSRSPSVAEEEPQPTATGTTMLGPNDGTPSLPRPTSWVSIGSNGSGEVFNGDLFDSFPSVPGQAKPQRTQTVPSRR